MWWSVAREGAASSSPFPASLRLYLAVASESSRASPQRIQFSTWNSPGKFLFSLGILLMIFGGFFEGFSRGLWDDLSETGHNCSSEKIKKKMKKQKLKL
jgi:hypothetical protein